MNTIIYIFLQFFNFTKKKKSGVERTPAVYQSNGYHHLYHSPTGERHVWVSHLSSRLKRSLLMTNSA
jgi:hypothetical protein